MKNGFMSLLCLVLLGFTSLLTITIISDTDLSKVVGGPGYLQNKDFNGARILSTPGDATEMNKYWENYYKKDKKVKQNLAMAELNRKYIPKVKGKPILPDPFAKLKRNSLFAKLKRNSLANKILPLSFKK